MAGRNPYELLFSVEVLHPYFRTPSRLRLRFEPDAATRAWMTRANCVVRVVDHVLQVWFEAERNGPYRTLAGTNAEFDLCFGVYAQDPQFTRYTDGLPTTEQPPLCFFGGEAVADGETWRVPPAQTLCWPWRSALRPDFVLAIPMTAALAPRADVADKAFKPGRAYSVALKSRESLWKYFLLGDWDGASIVDPDRAVVFEAAPDATLPDGRTVKAFRATSLIPLAERFDARFELHADAAPGGSPVKRVLPVPSAANLARDYDKNGRDLLVSEIFVPR